MQKSIATVLFVDPDPMVGQMVEPCFTHAGLDVAQVADSEGAARLLGTLRPDVIVLEWRLRGVSGLELARMLRDHPRTQSTPLMMLSARDGESDRLAGFEAGVDDYLGKPFSTRELLARVRGLIQAPADRFDQMQLEVGTLRLNLKAQRATCDGRQVDLGRTEFRLLDLLIQNANRVLTRAQIIHHIWKSGDQVSERTVDVHVRRLRETLEPTGYARHLRTVRGVGYAFVVNRPDEAA